MLTIYDQIQTLHANYIILTVPVHYVFLNWWLNLTAD